jgi:hypothetical protein
MKSISIYAWRILNGSTFWKFFFKKGGEFQEKMVLLKHSESNAPLCNPG